MATWWLFGHQLSTDLEGFQQIEKEKDIILMIEARSRSVWHQYHKKKLVLIFSAMRHFAAELRSQGYQVDYYKVESFDEGWKQHMSKHHPIHLRLHLPTDFRLRKKLEKWLMKTSEQGVEIKVFTEDSLFLVPEKQWEQLLPSRAQWKLDPIYRQLRKEHGILMDGIHPAGGKWSYDAENRKPPKKGLRFIPPLFIEADDMTKQVIAEVEQEYSTHFGSTEDFAYLVTRQQAYETLSYFIEFRLPTFGDYQDAMLLEDPFMSHSLLAAAMNIGLLHPLEVIHKAEHAYRAGLAPLASVEGFIRQILGWREYIRGVYLRLMPEYAKVNELEHTNPLPSFYWDADTKMNCLATVVSEVHQHAYSHHIQRLMVLGNFANLARVNPQQVVDWFNQVYIDAHDWVVLPNVLGMALYADGGKMSTKPYISSGQYIKRMSNYCKQCVFDPAKRSGDNACPFTILFWDYLDDHQEKLSTHPRMAMMYKNLKRIDEEEKKQIKQQAQQLFKKFE
ncbi:cryptochrome/photolyase family protein [Bacillus sp. REN10]|uniref:cryptochrome/photolyase family protein n=1 Tax=Bacillus sp. REN10 TaxID=2782541 RepID=UPI00193B9A24|nr:cryptochrome/photolyase family protein [Bacillus sp. REN10]